MPDEEINLLDDSEDEIEAGVTSSDAGAQVGGGGATAWPYGRNNERRSIWPCRFDVFFFWFEVASAHRFVFQEMMSGPNNLLWLDDKHVNQLVTIACNAGGEVTWVLVAELS